MIIAAGINDCDSSCASDVKSALLETVMAASILISDVRVGEVTCHHELVHNLSGGLDSLDLYIQQNYFSLPPAPSDHLQTTSDRVHVKSMTINYILTMWATIVTKFTPVTVF